MPPNQEEPLSCCQALPRTTQPSKPARGGLKQTCAHLKLLSLLVLQVFLAPGKRQISVPTPKERPRMSGKQQEDFVVLHEEQSAPLCLLSFLSLTPQHK